MSSHEDPRAEPPAEIVRAEPDQGKKAPKAKPRKSGASYALGGLVVGSLITIVMLVFILQNLQSSKVTFLAWDFELPLGISLLLSAIAGALITAFIGGVRIFQLKRTMRKV
ncbi:lipopolysaccharide assembly LapA domain-containing protein [Smaragdicoccus niigatensis]|uniref:LapA family protein n=1 Tax=Smaragdicoccus niigatensis TaxID=359359 RepID=UPI0003691EB9|nr:lipopolysaccharide assembly protein LapA domain-containing protein [Smaragdicoccus niigatensis]